MNLTAIIIVGIVTGGIVQIIKSVRKTSDQKANTQVEQEIDRLKERVKVLEEIVTDKNYELRREFESLKRTG